MSLAEPSEGHLTVSQLNELVKLRLEEDFPRLWVGGEVTNLSLPSSGHAYFTLKDDSCSVRAVMFKPYLIRYRKQLQEGKQVLLRCKPGLYTARGEFQLLADEARLQGVGEQQLLLIQLKEKLKAKGYFDPAHKKAIPKFPNRIALITSATGSAIRDLLEVLGKRWPLAAIVISPCRVQGELAPGEISSAIRLVNKIHDSGKLDVDLLIVGRGGGSQEDLWAFNNELVADAIHESSIPVISAVGHEDDLTIADLVADFRAVTPTEAACAATPDAASILAFLQESEAYLVKAITTQIAGLREHLKLLSNRKCFKSPTEWIHLKLQRIDDFSLRFKSASLAPLNSLKEKIIFLREKLESLSPLSTLKRGYSITLKVLPEDKTKLVTKPDDVEPGDFVKILLGEAAILAQVKGTLTRQD